jgi:hypothetical protein
MQINLYASIYGTFQQRQNDSPPPQKKNLTFFFLNVT